MLNLFYFQIIGKAGGEESNFQIAVSFNKVRLRHRSNEDTMFIVTGGDNEARISPVK